MRVESYFTFLQPGDPGYDANVRHGLIVATSNYSTKLIFGSRIAHGTIATALGTGNTNTNTIVSIQGDGNYAAKYCADLVIGIYDDWYLPSLDELIKIVQNNEAVGGFSEQYYWSSSEDNDNNLWAWMVNTDNFFPSSTTKDGGLWGVRAVRSF